MTTAEFNRLISDLMDYALILQIESPESRAGNLMEEAADTLALMRDTLDTSTILQDNDSQLSFDLEEPEFRAAIKAEIAELRESANLYHARLYRLGTILERCK